MHRFGLLLSLIAAFTLTGCGSVPVPLVPVSGTVTFPDGQPVTTGIIEAIPKSGGPSARGRIGEQGRFTLQTDGREGAVAGEHSIVVLQMVIADGGAKHIGKHTATFVIHPKYSRPETSGLVQVATAQGENHWKIVCDPAAPKRGW
jgi:hypothetical protein